MSPYYRVQFPPIVLNHLCLIAVLIYLLCIDCHIEGAIVVLELHRPRHRRLFQMFVDWHQVNGGLHLLVDVFSNNLCRRVELSLIETLEKRLIDVTVHIIRCALEGTSLIDWKCCG